MAIVSSPSLQLQTGLAGTLSESLHTAVVNEAATIVDDLSDALLEALLGDVLANLLSSFDVAAVSVKSLSMLEALARVTPCSSSMT